MGLIPAVMCMSQPGMRLKIIQHYKGSDRPPNGLYGYMESHRDANECLCGGNVCIAWVSLHSNVQARQLKYPEGPSKWPGWRRIHSEG
eukprot:13467135-Ditylum_brightwellii.AAC.1